jgi:hypothetical protein
MYCPNCGQANTADAQNCAHCRQAVGELRQRLFVGQQFIFVQADAQHPLALKLDEAVQTYRTPTILSRHRHAVSFGDEQQAPRRSKSWRPWRKSTSANQPFVAPLPDQPRLPHPSLKLLAIVADRQIYRPETEATLFIVAPDAANTEASLEIKLAGQKVYEAKAALNRNGLALHRYADLKEGEYTATVTLPDSSQAECNFSVAEFTFSPLIAALEKHEYADRKLNFNLKLLLLSRPYSGPVEFGLQCQVCGDRVVATQKVKVKDGLAQGSFDISGHGGPFHVQVTTPDGNTASVAFPGTGARERERLTINRLGQTADLGLLPWAEAQPVRGFYLGSGEVNMTPLLLENVHAATGRLQVAADDLSLVQIVTFDPRSGTSHVIERANLKLGDSIEFEVDAPYTLFTVGAMTKKQPFEGWGVVIKPVAFEVNLTTPRVARPGEEIEIYLETTDKTAQLSETSAGFGGGFFCWLLVYDARLEHESPVPKLARRIYDSLRDAGQGLNAGPVVSAPEKFRPMGPDLRVTRAMAFAGGLAPEAPAFFAESRLMDGEIAPMAAPLAAPKAAMAVDVEETLTMVVSPARMEFPELVYQELFYLEGQAGRTVKLGDQIGTWRVRAYLFRGVDYQELTADLQADKPLYAELDLPALAGPGDEIMATVNYVTQEPAELVIETLFGQTRRQVTGSGQEQFAIKGPGRVEVRLEGRHESDWSSRDVAPPGAQKVTASRLLILDRDQTAQGERVVVYPGMGQVLKDTITALLAYPFG